MKRVISGAVVSIILATPGLSRADMSCTLSDVRVDVYDHGGAYVHGSVNGNWVTFINLCGLSNGAQDCASKATDRRLAVALAAQTQGKSLLLYFWNGTSCSQITSYTIAAGVQLAP